MKKLILLTVSIGFCFGILCSCEFGLRVQNDNALAQTNSNSVQKANEKQPNNLYPSYLNFPVDLSLDGEKLNPILIAIKSFKDDEDIPKEKKNLNRYNIELRQDEKFFFVLMLVKRDSNKVYIGGETENGMDITYFVNKKDASVKRTFHK